MSEEEYNYLKNNPTKATMIDKFGYIHLYNKNYELHKIESSQFIYKIIDELSKKEKIIDEAKTKSIELQNKYGYILDDLIFLLDILGGVDNE